MSNPPAVLLSIRLFFAELAEPSTAAEEVHDAYPPFVWYNTAKCMAQRRSNDVLQR